jgi:hypothetical protein
MSFSPTVVDGVALTRENFRTPPKEMGIVPFWFWNGDLDPEEMRWQLEQYKDRGIEGVMLHGRFGLKVPYLSEGWFERVRIAVDLAREIGLDMWVYDEMNWPSGTAERQVLQKWPDLQQRYLELVPLHIDGPLFTFLEATDNRYVNTGDANPVAAFGVRTEEFNSEIKDIIDLTPNLSFNKVIPWEAPAGKWTLMYFLEKRVPYYIDTLNPESTNRFIEVTHDKYKEAVGDSFGSIVPGFYTDEPAMHYYHVGLDNYVVPWSKQMFKIFRERRGYDLRPHLAALYTSVGPKTAQIRYDFWRTLTEQYAECYYERIRDWCHENGVLFTGHLLFEELLRLHARSGGNLFRHLKTMDIIGVDHLYPKIGTEAEPQEHVALKIGSSAAHHFGSTRLLCESMGGTYWDCTLERMKWMANWEYVLGVNLFNNHGYHYSIEGERKRDWPPSQFYQHTWWKHYDQFTTYMSRLSHILSGGSHVAKVLVLYPIASMWTNYTPQKRDEVSNVIEHDFNYLTDALLRLHYDFDYVDEDVLAEAVIEDGKITIRDETFEVFILPPVTHIKRSTFTALKRFVDGGGSLIASTLIPVELLESDADEAEGHPKEVEELFGFDPVSILDAFSKGEEIAFNLSHRNGRGNVYFFEGRGLNKQKPREELRRILNDCCPPDVTCSDENVFYLHRVKDEHHVFFLANMKTEDIGEVEVSFEHVGKPELWDPNTGEITPINVFDVRPDGRLYLSLHFPPSEGRIVVFREALPETHLTSANFTVTSFDGTVSGHGDVQEDEVVAQTSDGRTLRAPAREARKAIELSAPKAFQLEQDNVFLTDRWKMTMEEGDFSAIDVNDSDWLDVRMGAWELQLPRERDDDSYPVTLWYRTRITMEAVPANPRLMIDGFSGSSFRLFINGTEVKDRGKRSWLDAEIKEVEIADFAKQGDNIVAVQLVVERRTDGMLDLLKIIGDFSLEGDGADMRIVPARETIAYGDWCEQGYEFFSGTGLYTIEVDVPEEYFDGRLFLEADSGTDDVLTVSVNGDAETVLPWRPHRTDLTDRLVAGRNTITLGATNTLINILEGIRRPSGLLDAPRIVHEPSYELS